MELKEMSLLQLGARLNELSYEIDQLTMQYNAVIDEIIERTPHLEGDPNMQPKIVVKCKKWGE